jgi:hypothetical protein
MVPSAQKKLCRKRVVFADKYHLRLTNTDAPATQPEKKKKKTNENFLPVKD